MTAHTVWELMMIYFVISPRNVKFLVIYEITWFWGRWYQSEYWINNFQWNNYVICFSASFKMIRKKKTKLLLLIVMILMMYLNTSECQNRRKQLERKLGKGLPGSRASTVNSNRSPSSSGTWTITCPARCTCRHRTVRCDKGTRKIFFSIPKGVRQM